MLLQEKFQLLKDNIKKRGSAAIAFSGGVDSTFLVKVAHEVLGDKVIAVTATSSTYPERELKEAIKYAKDIGIKHLIISSEELDIEGFASNPKNRCYYCKKELFTKIKAVAKENDVESVKFLFDIIGTTMTIDEDLMESATILGACGIAYVLRFIRAMIQGGIQIGFDAATASTIVNQTVKGAAELLIERHQHPEYEIDKVTTPKGCTIVGLNEMEHNGFSSSLIKGLVASFEKIEK